MKKLIVLMLVGCLGFGACTSSDILRTVEGVLGGAGGGGGVTQTDIISGLKQALAVGITNGASFASAKDGFFKNAKIKIPLPAEVKKVENTLRDLGMGNLADKAILSINRGAEEAAKSAKPIFISAIKQMTFQDAMSILKGDKNAATNYLRKTTTNELTKAFSPIVQTSLNKVGATKHWGDVFTRYNQIPLVKKQVNTDLNGYVTDMALKGLFQLVETEEAKIRKDPLARSTDLLKKVFKLQDAS